jgi:putative aminopeptidase FrvX
MDLYEVLAALILAPGVSGNEGLVRAVIAEQLGAGGVDPARLEGDELGNCWLHFGPAGEAERLLIAHMDELGLRITSIKPDGLCAVTAVGGIDSQLWEGTPVVVQTASGPVPGAIAPVSLHVTERQGLGPRERLKISDLLLDLGAKSAEDVAALGVSMLDPVTWPKRIEQLGNGMVQARSLDDRFGCAALLSAAIELAREEPAIPTVLAWSVQEEVGLRGARELAGRFRGCREVIAVDSYTVGRGPRDNRQFDGPEPGGGPVLRSWDGTVLVPDDVRTALLAKARELGTELQYGYMPGGNDASVFAGTGARVFALGVCVQYSHSQAERCHLADVERLAQLLSAWCRSDTGPKVEGDQPSA